VTVISGVQFPKAAKPAGQPDSLKGDVIDPYVVVSVNGVSADQALHKTKVVKNNGFNPKWRQEFKFALTMPELALLLIRVIDYDRVGSNNLIGQYALSVGNLREGYRCVPIKDAHDQVYDKASLLCHFKWI